MYNGVGVGVAVGATVVMIGGVRVGLTFKSMSIQLLTMATIAARIAKIPETMPMFVSSELGEALTAAAFLSAGFCFFR